VIAHEFWLEPSSFEVDRSAPVAVRLCVGDNFQTQALARDVDRIEEFFALHDGAKREILGRDGKNPAGYVRIEGEGTHVLGYRSNRAYTAQPDAKFVAYLHEDGLEGIIGLRAQPDQPDRPVRESYSRMRKPWCAQATAPSSIDRSASNSNWWPNPTTRFERSIGASRWPARC
jgi:hypothetical protein